MGWGRLREHRHRTTPAKAGVQSDTVSPKGRLVVSLDSRFHGNGVGSTPVNTATIPLPRKWESSRILCRPKGDPLFHWIPVSTGMGCGALPLTPPPYHSCGSGSPVRYCVAQRATLCFTGFPFTREWDGGRFREPSHRTTPAEAGVQSDTVSPEGRLVVPLDSRLHGNGMGGACVNIATVSLPRKRESSPLLCRPKGDPLFHWIPVCTGMVLSGPLPEPVVDGGGQGVFGAGAYVDADVAAGKLQFGVVLAADAAGQRF